MTSRFETRIRASEKNKIFIADLRIFVPEKYLCFQPVPDPGIFPPVIFFWLQYFAKYQPAKAARRSEKETAAVLCEKNARMAPEANFTKAVATPATLKKKNFCQPRKISKYMTVIVEKKVARLTTMKPIVLEKWRKLAKRGLAMSNMSKIARVSLKTRDER